MEVLEQLECDIAIILCKLERIFPQAFFDVMVHLIMHLVSEALIGGSTQFRWMYPFERYDTTQKPGFIYAVIVLHRIKL